MQGIQKKDQWLEWSRSLHHMIRLQTLLSSLEDAVLKFMYCFVLKLQLQPQVHISTYRVKHVWFSKVSLKISTSGQNETSDVRTVVGDVVLNGCFSNFSHVIVTFLHTKAGETNSWLTTTTLVVFKKLFYSTVYERIS